MKTSRFYFSFPSPSHLLIAALFFVSVGACRTRSPELYWVEGLVTLDGAPLAEGDILFAPRSSDLAPAGGKVIAGRFSLYAPPGECRVEITASRVIGQSEWDMGAIAENYLPARFNRDSELAAQVVPHSNNHFNFALTNAP